MFVGAAPANAAPPDYWDVDYISVQTPNGNIGPKVLDIKDGSAADGARAQLWQKNGNAQQRWNVTKRGTEDGYPVYELRNGKSSKCLDMATDGAIGNGTRVQQWTCNGTPNQRWIAIPVVQGNNWVKLVNQQGRRCLDVTNVNYADGALLQVWSCSGGWNQLWNIYP